VKIYEHILKGIEQRNTSGLNLKEYLQSLKSSVITLRRAYLQKPVYVPYDEESIQSAYLIAYLPHYYNLIYSILFTEGKRIFGTHSSVNISYIGGGPGSEVYGTISYILSLQPQVESINITIYDINADTWQYSHGIVQDYLVKELKGSDRIQIVWRAVNFDVTNSKDVSEQLSSFSRSNLVVIQNCLNEIASNNFDVLVENISEIFNSLSGNSHLLMTDLTSGARDVLRKIEQSVCSYCPVKSVKSTLNGQFAMTTKSLNGKLPDIIKDNLMDGSNFLIPRVNLTYDYVLLSIDAQEEDLTREDVGFNVLFDPVAYEEISAKTYVGIDFGTSTTVVSAVFFTDGKLKVRSLPLMQRDSDGSKSWETIVPSTIARIGSVTMVGVHANKYRSRMTYGKDVWYGFKEHLHALEKIDYSESVLRDHPQIPIRNGIDALVLFLTYVKRELLEVLKNDGISQDIEFAVSIPANFDSQKKNVLKRCMREAKIELDEAPFIYEPVAALINSVYERKSFEIKPRECKNVVILDVGAGTLDISIMEISRGRNGLYSKQLAVVRNGSQGGNLLDESIAKFLLRNKASFDTLSSVDQHEILSGCEKLKIFISQQVFTDSSVNYRLPEIARSQEVVQVGECMLETFNHPIPLAISFRDFDMIMRDYWNTIDTTVKGSLEKSKLNALEIHSVILTGGVSRNAHIRSFTRDFFSNSELILPGKIQEQVSRGVALHSFVINSIGKNVITPIWGNTWVLEGANGIIEIVQPGTLIPSEEIEIYPAVSDLKTDFFIRAFVKEESNNYKIFKIHSGQIAKLVFYIASDYELKCEVVASEEIYMAKEFYDGVGFNLLELNLSIVDL